MSQLHDKPSSASTQNSKRKHLETSPNKGVADLVGNVEVTHLMALMTESMEKIMNEKLKNLATKHDMEEIKQQINEVDGKVDNKFEVLKMENEALKMEIEALKNDRQRDQQQIKILVDQTKRKNVIFRGITMSDTPEESVERVCHDILKISPIKILSTRILFKNQKNNKINVVAEMENEYMAEKVFKNLKCLAGTTIKVEKDLSLERQQDRKVMFRLKEEIIAADKAHKVFVKNDSLKVGTHWMYWNNSKELMSGKKKAADVLAELYGDHINNINLNYNQLLEKILPKN